MPSRRSQRVNELIRGEVSDLIQRELRDPRLAQVVSITRVVTSADFRSAKLFVSTLGDEVEKEQTLGALRASAGFLRRALKPRLSLKTVPFLTFHRDDSIEGGARLLALINEVVPPPSEA